MVGHTLVPALGGQRKVDLSEFEASLGSSRSARVVIPHLRG